MVLAATAIAATAFLSCGGTSSPKNEKDSVAYALGIDIGTSVRNMDSTININTVAAGIKDAFNKKNSLEHEDAVNYLREYYTVRVPARAREEGEKYLAEIEKTNKNIQKTESGLLYEIIEPGDFDQKPTDDRDKVTVMYEGKLKDGQVFDSSYEKGEPVDFALNRVIRGWTEGMKLIGKGGKVRLYIPSDLAYGEHGQPRAQVPIGPNEPLVFDVELIELEPYEEAE